jgi:ubiquitin C-terminal hydrolase
MTNDKTIKIGDFGVAAKMAGMRTSINNAANFSGTVVGSPMFMSPEMIREEEYDKKTDVFSMGIAMYELCFFQSPKRAGLNADGKVVFKDVALVKNKNIYTNQLLSILRLMIEENKSKRPTSSELCQMIRAEYIKTFLKTSSLSAVTRCLHSLSRFPKYIINYTANKITQPITVGFTNAIQHIEKNINDKFNQFKEILAIHNPKLNTDTEINPVYIVALLLEKMHKELNVVQQINNDDEYVINSLFNGMEEDKSNKNEMFEKFFKHFSNNFNSLVSNHFFGILKEKKICQKCNMLNYNFGCFCLLTFDLNEICGMNYQNVDLINLFQAMHDRKKQYNLQDQVYCDRCLSYQVHTKNKQIYSMPYELIISLERGMNYQNKTLINFPFDLDLSKFVELDGSPNKFQLVGCVNYIEIKGEDDYISFTKNKNNNVWLCSDDDKINQADKSMALTY